MLRLILSAIAGAAAAYYWRDKISTSVNSALPGFRDRAADRLQDIGTRADKALEIARSRIASTVQAGHERLRATGTLGPRTIDTPRSTTGTDPIAERLSRSERAGTSDRPGHGPMSGT
jgi:hypothetical protein